MTCFDNSFIEQDYQWLIREGHHDFNVDEFHNMVNYAHAEGISVESARLAARDVLLGE